MARFKRTTETLAALTSGASTTTRNVSCAGAVRVHVAVICDLADQLATGNIVCTMSDGKTVTIVPAVFPGGSADVATHELDAAGVIITTDLRVSANNHRAIVLRASGDAGANSKYGVLPGVDYVNLALTKAATVGNAIYTVITTVYWD